MNRIAMEVEKMAKEKYIKVSMASVNQKNKILVECSPDIQSSLLYDGFMAMVQTVTKALAVHVKKGTTADQFKQKVMKDVETCLEEALATRRIAEAVMKK